ncbi:MAG: 3-deoxy-7-phosphoheptulonate synthase [Eubacteriales bacterium]|nr:3-deoxy-7-phosphoheptulonate synthase [Eubacteriales bacterium]MDD3882841.1 3-deoxy-7-phosphoheptulonate synthase [Eubacteriales bacterium]MDD4512123.1 3-deoxy-7-phosphoheptulonate synthase [Eubacteriales bacterium]
MSMEFRRRLPDPKEIRERYPVDEKMAEIKQKRDEDIARVFRGEDDRLLMIIGPCSADNKEAVLDYLERLKRLEEKVSDKLIFIPRVYTNKPRTTGDGYKGMLHQPDPEEKPDMLLGVVSIRDLHLCALRDFGFSCADEMLYPENYSYLSDLLSYVAIGARSVENQQHRLVSSGLAIPVGMKNPTEGDLSVMMNAVLAAQHHHTFLYRGWEVHSTGNPLSHAILRGYTDLAGNSISNYHYEDLLHVSSLYNERGLLNPAVVVDANHANSGKRYMEQIRIAKDVLHSRRQSDELRRLVKGIMIESYIEDGAQKVGGHVYGQSITDACLGWEKSEKLVLEIAEEV